MDAGPIETLEDQLRRRPWTASLFLNALVFGLTYGFFEAQFQSNDDTHMMLTAAGISKVSEASRMLLFSHVFIGDSLMALYAHLPAIPWYTIYLVLCLYAGHTAILGTLLHRRPEWAALGVYLLYALLLGSTLLLELQFTIVSAVLAIGAFSILVYLPFPNRSDGITASICGWLPMFLGVVLVVISGMIRWKSGLMVAGIFVPILLISWILRQREAFAVRASLFAAALGLFVFVHQLDLYAYESIPGWSQHFEFNQLRAQFTDYNGLASLPHKDRTEALRSVGWSPNDVEMIRAFIFQDQDVFSFENLRTIANHMPRANGMALNEAIQVPNQILRTSMAIAALILWLLCVVLAEWHWRSLLTCICTPIVVVVVVVGLATSLQAPPERVYWPLLLYLIVPPMMYMSDRKTHSGNGTSRLLVLCVVALALTQLPTAVIAASSRSVELVRGNLALREAIRQLQPRPDQLFVVWGAAFPWTAIRPFEVPGYLRDLRTFNFGTGQRTPDAAKVLADFGIGNIHLDLGRRGDLFFIRFRGRKYSRMYSEFIKQHYGLDVRWSQPSRNSIIRVTPIELLDSDKNVAKPELQHRDRRRSVMEGESGFTAGSSTDNAPIAGGGRDNHQR